MTLTSLIAIAIMSAPPFLLGESAPTISGLFSADVAIMGSTDVDVGGDARSETVVLVGRPGPTGALYPIGLAVLRKRPNRVSVLASARLPLNPAYDARLGVVEPQDLDGDGRVEIPVTTTAAGGGITERSTTWWRLEGRQLEGSSLRAVYHLGHEWRDRTVTELRAMSVTAGTITEVVERQEKGQPPSRVRVELRFDALRGRFVPTRTVRLDVPAQ